MKSRLPSKLGRSLSILFVDLSYEGRLLSNECRAPPVMGPRIGGRAVTISSDGAVLSVASLLFWLRGLRVFDVVSDGG